MDRVERNHKRKKFLILLYGEGIKAGNNLADGEYIRLWQFKEGKDGKEDFSKVTYWKNIDDIYLYVERQRFNANTYFTLATTDGEGGTVDNLKYRYFLAWDFDKKDDDKLDAKEVMFRFRKLGLWYHIIVDSGHGYHVYIAINKTDDFKKVEAVTKAIGKELGADPEAMKPTQVLRMPYSFNLKGKSKQVNIISMFEIDTVKRSDIDKLYRRFCNKSSEDKTIKYAMSKTQMPPCIKCILAGVDEGNRNFALKRLISFFKLYRYTRAECWNLIKEWNEINAPPIKDNELEYQFNYIFDKPYNCFGCITQDTILQSQIAQYCDKDACKSNKNRIAFIEGETVEIEYKICKKLEAQKRDVFQLRGNHLLIISVLKNNPEGLNTEQIIEKLTYKEKCCLSNKTLSNILTDLAENNYIC